MRKARHTEVHRASLRTQQSSERVSAALRKPRLESYTELRERTCGHQKYAVRKKGVQEYKIRRPGVRLLVHRVSKGESYAL